MNRGNRSEAIFITDSDRGTFLDGLTDSCETFEAVVHQSVLGTEEFVAWVKKKLPQKGQREIPSLKKLHRLISVDNIIGQVANAGNAPDADLRERKTAHKVLRQMAMELSYRYTSV
jgi:hypothetical protein